MGTWTLRVQNPTSLKCPCCPTWRVARPALPPPSAPPWRAMFTRGGLGFRGLGLSYMTVGIHHVLTGRSYAYVYVCMYVCMYVRMYVTQNRFGSTSACVCTYAAESQWLEKSLKRHFKVPRPGFIKPTKRNYAPDTRGIVNQCKPETLENKRLRISTLYDIAAKPVTKVHCTTDSIKSDKRQAVVVDVPKTFQSIA